MWQAVTGLGLAGRTTTEISSASRMGQAIVGITLPDRGRGFVNYNVLFERDAINGEIHVDVCCDEAFKQLFQYYKSFWLRNMV